MTIDEAIKHAKEQTDIFGGNHGEFLVNVAEWLEELKEYKANNHPKCSECAGCTQWLCDCSNVRNKAIDDFAEALRLKCLDSVYKEVGLHTMLKIAEQLKAGEVDE